MNSLQNNDGSFEFKENGKIIIHDISAAVKLALSQTAEMGGIFPVSEDEEDSGSHYKRGFEKEQIAPISSKGVRFLVSIFGDIVRQIPLDSTDINVIVTVLDSLGVKELSSKRKQMLAGFLAGDSYEDIAFLLGVLEGTVRAGLTQTKMALIKGEEYDEAHYLGELLRLVGKEPVLAEESKVSERPELEGVKTFNQITKFLSRQIGLKESQKSEFRQFFDSKLETNKLMDELRATPQAQEAVEILRNYIKQSFGSLKDGRLAFTAKQISALGKCLGWYNDQIGERFYPPKSVAELMRRGGITDFAIEADIQKALDRLANVIKMYS